MSTSTLDSCFPSIANVDVNSWELAVCKQSAARCGDVIIKGGARPLILHLLNHLKSLDVFYAHFQMESLAW